MRLRSGGLFAGAGGLEQGIQEAFEADPAWLAEYEAAPSKVLAFRFPGVPNYGDVTKIKWTDVEPVDVVCAGYPCQPFSLAGRRKGTDDERHLWPYIVEAVRELRPRWVAFENVRGHLSMGFDEVLRDLTRLGYDAEWVILKASSVGAPHKRERLFILGWPHENGVVDDRRPFATLHEDGWMEFDQGIFGPIPFDGQLPISGSLRSGNLYDAPEPAEAHDGFLLRTPAAAEAEGGPRNRFREGATMRLSDQITEEMDDGEIVVLPTPSVSNAQGNAERSDGTLLLPGAAMSLFPTPRASDGEKGGPNQRGSSGDLTMSSAVQTLLPTPAAGLPNDGEDSEQWLARRERVLATGVNGNGMGMPLAIAVQLLPTPSVAMADGGQTSRSGDRKGEPLLGAIAVEAAVDWGKYTGAVRRWERVFGFPVPSPVKFDGKGGKARLSSLLTEWMMGFFPGWITDPAIGLTRSEQLKICGNGVLSLQAATAYRLLLSRRGVPAVRAEVAS